MTEKQCFAALYLMVFALKTFSIGASLTGYIAENFQNSILRVRKFRFEILNCVLAYRRSQGSSAGGFGDFLSSDFWQKL